MSCTCARRSRRHEAIAGTAIDAGCTRPRREAAGGRCGDRREAARARDGAGVCCSVPSINSSFSRGSCRPRAGCSISAPSGISSSSRAPPERIRGTRMRGSRLRATSFRTGSRLRADCSVRRGSIAVGTSRRAMRARFGRARRAAPPPSRSWFRCAPGRRRTRSPFAAIAERFAPISITATPRWSTATPSRFEKLSRPFAGAALVVSAATGNLARRALRGETAYPGLRELVTRFYRATIDGSESPINAAESVDVARARDRLIGARQLA